MPTPTQDIALFQSMKQGNRLALNSLFLTYYKGLCQFAYQYTRNKEETEEIVSDVFFSLWQNRDRITIEVSVKAYLYTCVKNASIALVKKRQPLFNDLEDVLNSYAARHHEPDRLHEYVELKEYFNRAVESLPIRCKQVFILNRFDNLKYKEISTLLNISEKTVENQIVKALVVLRNALNRYTTKHY